jgi:hypothetical protein
MSGLRRFERGGGLHGDGPESDQRPSNGILVIEGCFLGNLGADV